VLIRKGLLLVALLWCCTSHRQEMATGGVVVTRLPESKVREWIADVCPNQRDETRRVALGTHSAIVFDMTAGKRALKLFM